MLRFFSLFFFDYYAVERRENIFDMEIYSWKFCISLFPYLAPVLSLSVSMGARRVYV